MAGALMNDEVVGIAGRWRKSDFGLDYELYRDDIDGYSEGYVAPDF
jgi:hypothetical protein